MQNEKKDPRVDAMLALRSPWFRIMSAWWERRQAGFYHVCPSPQQVRASVLESAKDQTAAGTGEVVAVAVIPLMDLLDEDKVKLIRRQAIAACLMSDKYRCLAPAEIVRDTDVFPVLLSDLRSAAPGILVNPVLPSQVGREACTGSSVCLVYREVGT